MSYHPPTIGQYYVTVYGCVPHSQNHMDGEFMGDPLKGSTFQAIGISPVGVWVYAQHVVYVHA
jgi:hypothetical protein